MYCLAVGCPYPYISGGGTRAFEILKHFDENGVTPILYIPFSDLASIIYCEKVYGLEKFAQVLKELERFNVKIPSELYETLEKISLDISHYLDCFRKDNMHGAFSSFKKLIQFIRGFKDNISFVKKSLPKLMQDEGINLNKLEFIYSMHECPSFVIAGAFLSKSFKKRLYIQLQLEPFRPLRELTIDDWTSRVTLGKQHISRELARLFLLILQHMFTNPRYSYSYALRNNLDGLLAVSEAPLKISGLDSWAHKKGIKIKIVRPGNAVDEKIFGKYVDENERRRLLREKEDMAVYWARLRSSKGLFDIIPIAKKLSMERYRLTLIGKFDHMVERKIFFRLCREKEIKNVEYLGWLPREELINIVSKSKVLIYPSHSDAFSLVVLEALFLGCSVVAYDIPAIRSVYKGLKPVKIVREHDYKSMAEEAIKILKRDISEHEEEHLDRDFINFLKMHSSWKYVAKADIEAIKEMISH